MIARCRARDNAQSRSPSAKCCELHARLHDRFRLEAGAYTILSDEDMEIGNLSDCNHCWHAGGGWGGGGSTGGGTCVSPGRSPGEGAGGGAPACHETNLKVFMNKFCHGMRHDL